jgi:hypothetical protein
MNLAVLTGADTTQLVLRKKMVEELIIEESTHEGVKPSAASAG